MTSRPVDCCDAPIPPRPMVASERTELVSILKALGDETRLDVFRLIAAQDAPVCVCDITERFNVSQPTISHHLKVLREVGLISVSRRGNWAFYAMDTSGLAVLDRAMSEFAAPRKTTVA